MAQQFPPGTQRYPRPAARTRFRAALGAASIWAAVSVLVAFIGVRNEPNLDDFLYFGLPEVIAEVVVGGLIAALVVWAIRRRSATPFWQLLLLTLPLFLLLLVINGMGAQNY